MSWQTKTNGPSVRTGLTAAGRPFKGASRRHRVLALLVPLAMLQACAAPEGGPEGTGSGSATLSWIAPTQRTDGTPLRNLKGYKIYYGRSPKSLKKVITVQDASITRYEVRNLGAGKYYFAMTAFDADGLESERSNIASKVIRRPSSRQK